MPVKKGNIPWNKNRKETRQDVINKQRLGHIGQVAWNKGMKLPPLTPEQRAKISKALKGTKHPWVKGHPKGTFKHSDETKRKLGDMQRGEKSWKWKGGISIGDNVKSYREMANRKRRNHKLNAGGLHTSGEWELLKLQYGLACPCCHRAEPLIKLSKDHIIPLSRGGSDWIENIQPLCLSCNKKKHVKVIKYEK